MQKNSQKSGRNQGKAEGKNRDKNRDWSAVHTDEVKMLCTICIAKHGITKLLEGQIPQKKKNMLVVSWSKL